MWSFRRVINIIADTYSYDKTSIFLNNDKITDIEITSGIRQGCNISALLFVIVTYKIIESIHNFGFGYKDEDFQISSLFYMDDGIIFAENQKDMSIIINRLYRVCLKFGLQLNRNKCKIMIINNKENIQQIEDFEVTQNIKYLGIILDNKRKCFNTQINKQLQNELKYSNQIYSILGNACNRMLIDKTIWN